MVVAALGDALPASSSLRVLLTSGTQQGHDSLLRGCAALRRSNLDVTVAYFPFDAPHLMRRAFNRFKPRLAVTVETELWPAFLVCAKDNDIPVYLINGRMSEKSFATYRRMRWFFHRFGPDRIWAVSQPDRERFARVVGDAKVAQMNNIKFDRISPKNLQPSQNTVAAIIANNVPFILFGSVRREEEDKIQSAITLLLQSRPDIIIGLFPKHVERADNWLAFFNDQQIACARRSTITTTQPVGSAIVWDIYGELAGAYSLAAATFVGGSLVNLGGQNFLEPLAFGLTPIIGPYWKHFAWVGREIVENGLVVEVENELQLVDRLLESIDSAHDRQAILTQVREYFEPRKGGTQQICRELMTALQCV